MTLVSVNRKPIRRISDQQHLFAIASESLDQPGGQAMIMVSARGLNVRIILVEAQIDEAGFGFVIPFTVAVPELRRARLKGNPIQCHPKPCAPSRSRLCGHLRVSWQM